MRWATWITALAAALLWSPTVGAASATLTWTPPEYNTDGTLYDDPAGYVIRAGCNQSGTYELEPVTIDDPGITSWVYEGLPNDATCYFVATAFNASGVESDYSGEATKTTAALDEPIPGPVENLRVEWSEGSVTTASYDFTTDAVGTTNDADGETNITGFTWETNASFPWRAQIVSEASAEGGQAVEIDDNAAGDTNTALVETAAIGDVASSTQIEVLSQFQIPTDLGSGIAIAAIQPIAMRMSSSGSGGIRLAFNNDFNDFMLRRYNGGTSWTTHGTFTKTVSQGQWVWARVRVDTSDNWYARVWTGAVGDEPATWDIDAESISVELSGYSGMFVNDNVAEPYRVGYWSIGTAGDAAPSPSGGGSTVQAVDNRLQSQLYKQFLIR